VKRAVCILMAVLNIAKIIASLVDKNWLREYDK